MACVCVCVNLRYESLPTDLPADRKPEVEDLFILIGITFYEIKLSLSINSGTSSDRAMADCCSLVVVYVFTIHALQAAN